MKSILKINEREQKIMKFFFYSNVSVYVCLYQESFFFFIISEAKYFLFFREYYANCDRRII